jgi:excisionase family DNA binding protein
LNAVASDGSQFYREQAENCRDLIRLTDQLRRRLSDMAADCDYRARKEERSTDQTRMDNRPPPLPQTSQTTHRLTLSIKDIAQLLGLSRTTIYRLIGDGQLETVKIGNRTLIRMTSIRSLLDIPE